MGLAGKLCIYETIFNALIAMKLICFPHYTAGGLLCDILEQKFSPTLLNGGIGSESHALARIGDSSSVFTEFNLDEFNQAVSAYQDKDVVVGTHCWPGQIDIAKFEQVILITTETSRSKVYRWLRAWHFCFAKSCANLTGMELIDKQRELAKNYLTPFRAVSNATNLEFADIVESTAEFRNAVNNLPILDHLTKWKETNYFLYNQDLWNNNIVQRYHEAEFEVTHGRFYQYQ